jgi:hypothetical protein
MTEMTEREVRRFKAKDQNGGVYDISILETVTETNRVLTARYALSKGEFVNPHGDGQLIIVDSGVILTPLEKLQP